MAVSSIKGCWFKFSSRVREYLVDYLADPYYQPTDEADGDSRLPARRSSGDGRACGPSVFIGSSGNERTSHSGGGGASATTKDRRNGSHKSTSRRAQHQVGCTEHTYSHKQNQISKPQLPPGYSRKKTPAGQVYFVDLDGHKYWFDPCVPKELLTASLNLDSLVGRLSSAWEVRQTPTGKTYYVNHTKETTQFTDPRLVVYRDFLMSVLKHQRLHAFSPTRASDTLNNNHADNSIDRRLGDVNLSPAGRQSNSVLSEQSNSANISSSSANNSNHHHHLSDTQSSQISPRCPHQNNCPKNPLPDLNSTLSRIETQRKRHDPISGSGHRRCPPTGQDATRLQQGSCSLRLMCGSHQNLSTSTGGHSNTLNGPVPNWLKPSSIASLRRQLTGESGARSQTDRNAGRPSRSSQCNTITTTTSATVATSNCDRPTDFILNPLQAVKGDTDPKCNGELFDKISILRQELLKQQVISHPCRIDVNRKRIYEESFRVVSHMQPRDLKKRLLVKFRGEEGLDYGGVAREWFYLLSREILNPVHGLFQYTSDDIYNLQINPDSGIADRDHLSHMNFCGRIIGMAVFHGHFIEGHFTLPFYKMLLRKPITLSDIEFVDPALYRSLCWILENDITNVLDNTFLVQHDAYGQLQEHELKENGRNIAVSEENKEEYVTLYVNFRCRRGIESQFEALQRGFYELISSHLLEGFDEHELELLIGGLSKIDIDDWRLHTKLKNCCVDTPLVRWFWDIVKSYNEDRRARLLQFVTGSPRVPIQGFKALQGVNSELRLFTIHLIRNACTDNLPKSHTCFNRIDLPPYESYEKLRDKLTQAIEETMGFAMQ